MNIKKLIASLRSRKNRKEEFLKKLRFRPGEKVSIRNAIVGSNFNIYNPSLGHVINAAMLKPGYWACWATKGHLAGPMNYFTDKELCVLITREITSLNDHHKLVVQDPGNYLVFHE